MTWLPDIGGRMLGRRKLRTLERAKRWDETKTIAENARIMGSTKETAYGMAIRLKLKFKRVKPTQKQEEQQ